MRTSLVRKSDVALPQGTWRLRIKRHSPVSSQRSNTVFCEGTKRAETIDGRGENGAPGRIRTCCPRLRRPMLYPDELRARGIEMHLPRGAGGVQPKSETRVKKEWGGVVKRGRETGPRGRGRRLPPRDCAPGRCERRCQRRWRRPRRWPGLGLRCPSM